MNAASVAVLFAIVAVAAATTLPVTGLSGLTGQQYYVPTAYSSGLSGYQYVQQPQGVKYVQQQQYAVPSTQQYVYNSVPTTQQLQYTVPSYYSSPVVSTYGAGVYSPSLVYGYGK